MKKTASASNKLVNDFFKDLLDSKGPSGFEFETQKVLDKHVKPFADDYAKDAMGNRFAHLNTKGSPKIMLAGHMDELGLIVRYIDDKGFIYFDTIGGHDLSIISGRRVFILNDKKVIKGVTGKRAIHLMDADDRKKVPQLHDIWIDIGAKDKKEALKYISIGDPIVYDHHFEMIHGSIATSRAFDDRAGCYAVMEALRRLSKSKSSFKAHLVSVATTQEEIGTRGAIAATYGVDPDIALAVDVGHATDHPDCNKKKHGEFYLGKGPIICRGANINPIVYKKLVEAAQKHKIPYQLEAEPRPTGTDARAIQTCKAGVATGLISIPLRYMHTPSEMVDLQDVENTVKLLMAFVKSFTKAELCHF